MVVKLTDYAKLMGVHRRTAWIWFRFGLNYIKTLFQGEIVVINEAEDDKEDLMSDFISVITSFCARVYGLRRNRRRTEKLLDELRKD